tara:strand:+ start:178 stop:465 length:288 start_codon:yes stop_codon:yes gene_type:complete
MGHQSSHFEPVAGRDPWGHCLRAKQKLIETWSQSEINTRRRNEGRQRTHGVGEKITMILSGETWKITGDSGESWDVQSTGETADYWGVENETRKK